VTSTEIKDDNGTISSVFYLDKLCVCVCVCVCLFSWHALDQSLYIMTPIRVLSRAQNDDRWVSETFTFMRALVNLSAFRG